MEKRHDGGVTQSGALGYRFGRNFDSNHRKKIFDPYGPMPMEIDTMKRKTVHGKPKKGQNKKTLKCYSYGKPGHFAKDCRSKNMVSRPQFNMMRRVPIMKEGTPESNKPSPVWDNPGLNAMLETVDVMGETTGRLQEGIDRLLKELDSDDEITDDPLTMSDQWEEYLQGFPYEAWDSTLLLIMTGLENQDQYNRYYNRFQELRNERLGLGQDEKA